MTTAPNMTAAINQQRAAMIEQVAQTRRQLRRNGVWSGGALLVLGVSLWMALVAALDMLLVLAVPLRVAAWAALWLILIGGAVLTLWPALRPMTLERVAFAIERAIGRMHNRLVTVLDLPALGPTADATWTVERLVERTAERMHDYEPRVVADDRPAKRLTFAASAAALALLTMFAAMPSQMTAAVSRIVQPTQPIAPPSWVRFEVAPGDAAVLHGESVTIDATLTRGALEPDQPVTLRLVDDTGRPARYPMRHVAGHGYQFTIDALDRSYTYRIETGRTWQGPYTIARIDRPRLTEVAARVHLPPYMQRDEPRDVSDPTDQVDAVRGSTIVLDAEFRGQVHEAVIELLEPHDRPIERTELEQRTWFDDHLPADAESIGQWRWVDAPVRSGRRAHTFRWDRAAYGFRTRLNPLALGADESFYVFALLDEREPPQRIIITLESHDTSHAFTWGDDQDHDGDAHTHLGDLPTPGAWHRLAIPAARFTDQSDSDIIGVQFAIDAGAITFDRAGAMREIVRERTERTFEPVDAIAMSPHTDAPDAGVWRGRIAVDDTDMWYRLRAVNDHGYTSEPMQPVPILATRDRPPELVIERPGRHVTLTEPRPVPLVVRASDDYGLAAIALETAATRDAFADESVSEIAHHELWTLGSERTVLPPTSRTVAESLTAQRFALSPGEGVYYRAVATDTHGQRTQTPAYRFAHEPAGGTASPSPVTDTAVAGMLDELAELAALDEGAIELMGELTAALPEGTALDLERSRATLVDADGRPLGPEALAEAFEAWRRGLDAAAGDDATAWEALRERFRERQQRLAGLAERMSDAVAQGRAEATLLPVEPEVLEALAREAQRMAEAHPTLSGDAPEAWALPELADFQARRDAERAELAMLEAELAELLAARAAAGDALTAGQQQLADLHQRMRTRQQAAADLGQMQAVEAQMVDQQERIEALQRQIEQLRSEAELVDASMLDEVSDEHAEREREALAALEEARAMLEAGDAWDDDLFLLPDAPWIPPGEERERVPTEGDEADLGAGDDGDDAATAGGASDASQEMSNWWDEPLEGLDDPTRWTIDERYADRHAEQAALREQEPGGSGAQGDRDDAGGPSGPMTPRQMMTQRQAAMAGMLARAGERFESLHADTAAARADLAAALHSQDVEAIERALASPGAARALAMAGLMPTGASSGDDTGSGAGRSALVPVMVVPTEAHEPGASRHSAALYRLPPELREPLREAMREQGPAAYQPLIDGYYRRLSREVDE